MSDEDCAFYSSQYDEAVRHGQNADVFTILAAVERRIGVHQAFLAGQTEPTQPLSRSGSIRKLTPHERAASQLECLSMLRDRILADIGPAPTVE